jgi:DNA-binding response OmpR family regulator
MSAGVDDFLKKPLDPVELELRLRVAKRILEAMSRIYSLETMVTICAYTKQVNIPDEGWQTIETFLRRHLGLTLTHGVEPGYYESHIRPQLERLKAQRRH